MIKQQKILLKINSIIEKDWSIAESKGNRTRHKKQYNEQTYIQYKTSFNFNDFIGESSCNKKNKVLINFEVINDKESKSGRQYLKSDFWGGGCYNINYQQEEEEDIIDTGRGTNQMGEDWTVANSRRTVKEKQQQHRRAQEEISG